MSPSRTIAFLAFGWALPDVARARWQAATFALLVSCIALIVTLWTDAIRIQRIDRTAR